MKAAETSTPPPQLTTGRGPWWWVPSIYFTQALPNSFVATLSTYAYTRLNVSSVAIGNAGWLAAPWMFKPLWSPLVELYSTERRWIWRMQYVAALAFVIVALAFTTESFLFWTAAGYLLLAFASATHDIAADGYYMRALSRHDQTWFNGFRSFFFRGGLIASEVVLLGFVGLLIRSGVEAEFAWMTAHGIAAGGLFVLATYHAIVLPTLPERVREHDVKFSNLLSEVVRVFAAFFRAVPLGTAIPFLLFYRFAEAQLVRFAGKFLLDPRSAGGLGLLEEQVAVINGIFGIGALLVGGIAGSLLAARYGLRKVLIPMAILINVPNVAYVLLAYFQPENLSIIAVAVTIEKLGYGFGFTGYMLYMLYLSQGQHQTSFYAICTGFMTLGMMLPTSPAGWLLKWLGYSNFFNWVMIATIPSFIVTWMVFVTIDPQFGAREDSP
jgi:PAT family beta-lactamase induction signal transducer AmpG